MEIRGFFFYKSFLTAINMLPEDCQLLMFKAVCDYGLDQVEPTFEGTNASFLNALWVSIQPQLDANFDRIANSRRGGAPFGNQNAKKQPKTTQNNIETTAEQPEQLKQPNKDKYKDKDKDKDKDKYKDYYYSSSFPPLSENQKEEQQKKDFILSIHETFFFRNYQQPSKEVQDFLSYNNLGDRTWESMTPRQRSAALQRWTQKPPQKPRFSEDLLAMWKDVIANIKRLKPDNTILADALADSIAFAHKKGFLEITCSKKLYQYIEANLNAIAPPIRKYMSAQSLNNLHYNVTDK